MAVYWYVLLVLLLILWSYSLFSDDIYGIVELMMVIVVLLWYCIGALLLMVCGIDDVVVECSDIIVGDTLLILLHYCYVCVNCVDIIVIMILLLILLTLDLIL
jgi:hypothetical protein